MFLQNPAPFGHMSLAFGATTSGYSKANPHKGEDHGFYNASPKKSRELYFPADGIVTSVTKDGSYNNGYGNRIVIQSGDVYVWLCHLATGSISVSTGDRVTSGQRAGTMGSTGRVTGDHLHMEVRLKGIPVDPAYYYTHHIPGTPSSGKGDSQEDDMTPAQEKLLVETAEKVNALYQAMFYGAQWRDKDGANHKANYGLLQINVFSQELIAKNGKVLSDIEAVLLPEKE